MTTSIQNKAHIQIDGYLFMLSLLPRANRHVYGKEEAPTFVNKFSSGDPNYRDASFFPHFVQNNWTNGFDQEKFNDGGKFYRSSGVDTTIQEKLTLEKKFSSAGQTASGIKVTTQAAWRASAGASLDLEASSSQYAQAADSASLSLTGDFTLELWVKFESLPSSGNKMNFVSKWNEGANQRSYRFGLRNNGGTYLLFLGVSDDGTGGAHDSQSDEAWTPSTGTWYHVAVTYTKTSSGNVQFYVDGVAQGAVHDAADFAANDNASQLVVGAQQDTAYTNLYDGLIGQVRIWNTVRTATQILSNKGVEIDSDTNLMASWHLSNVYTDSSGNSNTLVPSGTPSFGETVPGIGTVGETFTQMVGTSDGGIYSWNGAATYTELFNARRLTWFDTVADEDSYGVIGDSGGTEVATAQSFQIPFAMKVKSLQLHLRKLTGSPTDITVRIETNNAGVPSGTLADAGLTATISASSIGAVSFDWYTVDFASAVSLSATTTYWIVLKIAAGSNDNHFAWGQDASSPSYTNGNEATSNDGGTTWTARTVRDCLFRVLGNTTSVNASISSTITGSQKLYFGTGDPSATVNGDARIIEYDGTNFTIKKVFNTTNESSVLSFAEFGQTTNKLYIGLGHKAKIYSTTDMSTFTLAKTITVPNNPGYVFSLKEYNGRLYAGGGFPEQFPGVNSQFSGFLYSYDEFNWVKVGDFEHTVITVMEVFDNLLFMGTIRKRLYVYNTASVDKLVEFPWDVQVTDLKKWDDKLAISLATTPGFTSSGFESVYLFDRSGFHNAFSVSGKSWYSLGVFNNNLMAGNNDGYVYQTSSSSYQSSGTMQLSYFEAALPNIDKKWRNLTLQFDALSSGCTIVVDYKTDESDSSWTNLGTASTTNSLTASFDFPVAFYSKKLSIRVTLTTSSDSLTPTLRVIDMKYVLIPDFKYIWKMKLSCVDNIVWLDKTQPISRTTVGAITLAQSTLTLEDTGGFPTKHTGVLCDSTGTELEEIAWTGKSSTQLTGVTGLTAHASGTYIVKMTGRTMHKLLLSLKSTKTLYTFTDIDSLTYTILFHNYQADNFVVNQDNGIENDVPITLLEA